MSDSEDKSPGKKPGSGGRGKPGSPDRRARGFQRAGGLIDAQLRTNSAKRGFAQARLASLWADVIGPDLAPLCTPVKLTTARGPAGGTLTVAVAGALAPQVQMMVPVLRERINRAMGPGTVGRIVLTHAVRPEIPSRRATPAPPKPAPKPDPDLAAELSSIGDPDLRAALETFARNVLSKTAKPKQTES